MSHSDFSDVMTDSLTLVKKNGERLEAVQANVSSTAITTFDQRLVEGPITVEEEDVMLRQLPNGLVERYVVLDTGFSNEIHGVEAHYSMKVRKETDIRAKDTTLSRNVFNFHGDNSRVNVNSQDYSSNVVNLNDESVFVELKTAVQNRVADEALRNQLLNKIEELQNSKGTTLYVAKFQEFTTLAANVITIVGPFIPQLAAFLS